MGQLLDSTQQGTADLSQGHKWKDLGVINPCAKPGKNKNSTVMYKGGCMPPFAVVKEQDQRLYDDSTRDEKWGHESLLSLRLREMQKVVEGVQGTHTGSSPKPRAEPEPEPEVQLQP